MKLLLAYLFVTFILALRATRKGRSIPIWPLAIAAFFVGAAYLKQRFL
jgi:hypothetical protein